MRIEDCTPGTGVVYRPHPDARAEDGTVIRVSDSGLVFVLYVGDRSPKATPASLLTPLRGAR